MVDTMSQSAVQYEHSLETEVVTNHPDFAMFERNALGLCAAFGFDGCFIDSIATSSEPSITDQQRQSAIIPIQVNAGSCLSLQVQSNNTALPATTILNIPILKALQLSLQQQLKLFHDQQQAQQQAERWQHALHNSFGVWDWQLPTDQLICSEQWLKLLGMHDQKAQQLRDLFKRFDKNDRKAFSTSLRNLIDGTVDILDCESRLRHENGHYVWLRIRGKVTDRSNTGQALRIVGTGVDIQRRKTSEEEVYDLCQQLQASETRYRELMKHASDAIIITDLESKRIIDANHQATFLSGYNLKELFTKDHSDLIYNPHGPSRCFEAGLHRDMLLIDKSGNEHSIDVGCTLINISGKQLLQCIIHDISERKATEEHLHHMAHHDPLTGLPNRILFRDRLQQAIHKSERNNTLVALCFFDLDNFKEINDSLGHDAGDLVLNTVAERLTHGIRASDTAARLGGDEFVTILEEIETPTVIQTIAAKILEQINRPISVAGHQVQVTSSLGISIYPTTSRDLDTLISHADTAMYNAKQVGNCLEFFCLNPSQVQEDPENLELWPTKQKDRSP